MKAEEIRQLSEAEIAEKVTKNKKELFTLRVQAKTGKLEKQNRIRMVRRDTARLLTIKNEFKREA